MPVAVLVALLAGVLAAPAAATFHLMSIREVYPGSTAAPDAEYVELQMYAPGQNFVAGHQVKAYDASGALVRVSTLPADVPNGEDQRTVLLATPEAEATFGVIADAGLSPSQLDGAGGAVCWEALDCASWGSFSGTLPSAAGSPAAPSGLPDGMALRRTIAPGCPTELEATDDRDNSVTDFAAVFPAPRPNAVSPGEHSCPGSESSGGGFFGGSGSGHPGRGSGPQTTLTHRPPRRTRDRTPTFSFSSEGRQTTFQCKLDRLRFRSCRSPFTAPRLTLGRHVFQVRARERSGVLDSSPARWAFRVTAAP